MNKFILGIVIIIACLIFPFLPKAATKHESVCRTTIHIVTLARNLNLTHVHNILSNDVTSVIIVSDPNTKYSSIVVLSKPNEACIWQPLYDKDYADYTNGLITIEILHAKRVVYLTNWVIKEIPKYHTQT